MPLRVRDTRTAQIQQAAIARLRSSFYILAATFSLIEHPAAMNEKPESEEFDEEEDDDSAVDSDDLDVDHLIADLDKRKKSAVKAGEPAWRRLERIREERETAEQLSDFDDYEIEDDDDVVKPPRK
jgi:hypothetical protein